MTNDILTDFRKQMKSNFYRIIFRDLVAQKENALYNLKVTLEFSRHFDKE